MMNHGSLLRYYPNFMLLRLFVENDNQYLKMRYVDHIRNHNNKILQDPDHIDAGFDLFVPHNFNCIRENRESSENCENNFNVNKVNHKIKCSATVISERLHHNTGYYLHPRSSIIKTPLRLSNSTGIVDSGYRGNIIGAFDCKENHYFINEFDRLIQICAPSLMPIYVELVENEDDLGQETARGGGGFGSSGR